MLTTQAFILSLYTCSFIQGKFTQFLYVVKMLAVPHGHDSTDVMMAALMVMYSHEAWEALHCGGDEGQVCDDWVIAPP